jgi:hypothetical protein
MPGKKYLCQKNSADHKFSNESNDGGIGSMDSRDENHLESDDEINIHDIPTRGVIRVSCLDGLGASSIIHNVAVSFYHIFVAL